MSRFFRDTRLPSRRYSRRGQLPWRVFPADWSHDENHLAASYPQTDQPRDGHREHRHGDGGLQRVQLDRPIAVATTPVRAVAISVADERIPVFLQPFTSRRIFLQHRVSRHPPGPTLSGCSPFDMLPITISEARVRVKRAIWNAGWHHGLSTCSVVGSVHINSSTNPRERPETEIGPRTPVPASCAPRG